MSLLIEKQILDYLKQKIRSLHMIDIDSYSDLFIARRIFFRMNTIGMDSPLGYARLLQNDREERTKLLNELTIPVTTFFRNKDAYDTFLASALMELLKEKKEKNQRSIVIWSAGCSSGEEPYSIAMMLLELLQWRIEDFDIKIIGTDISAKAIEESKKGMYSKDEVKEAPPEYIEKYFDKTGDVYIIKDKIKKLVQFIVGDIISGSKPVPIDIIFCRNTIIYFTTEVKEDLFVDFYHCLVNGGYLVLGMTEALTGPAQIMFKTVSSRYRIYKKDPLPESKGW